MSTRWLRSLRVCARERDLYARIFGDEDIPISRDLMERAMEAGLNVVWIGVRLIDDDGRREFIAFACDQRHEALTLLLEPPLPTTADGWLRRYQEERTLWIASDDHDARARALVCRDMAQDLAADSTEQAATAASLHVRRAVSMAGLDEQAASKEQADWLFALIEGAWK